MKKILDFKRQSFILGLAGVFLSLPLLASAIGQTTNPIVVDNALRGGEFQDTLIIINNDNEQVEVNLSVDGQIASWTKFYLPSDLKTPIQSFSLAKDGQANVIAVFSVPKDTANGDYAGYVGAGKKLGETAQNKDESSVSVQQKINREVKIKVTDTEIVKLLVSVIPDVYDLRSGENLSVRFIYDNQSNVALSPQIQFRIKKDDKTVYNAIFPYPDGEEAVRSMAQHEIPALKIPTAGLENGKYIVEMDFLHNGKSILTQSFKFNVRNGSVLGAWEINSTSSWIALSVIVILAIIMIGFFLSQKMKKKNMAGGEAI